MDSANAGYPLPTLEPKKLPRKPRPSEIAAKKAKAAAKRKLKTKKKAPKRKAAKKSKAKRPKVAKRKTPAKAAKSGALRTERLDMRVTKAQRKVLEAKARKLSRSVTAVAWEAISRGLKGIK